MRNWQCPIEHLDEDIREVVRLLYENDMKPYMSCSGSYKDHNGKPCVPKEADVEILDSELTREFMAILINDKRFKCSISKENACKFYDNQLPLGFRFKIEFENVCGDVSKDLQSVLQEVIQGKKSNLEDRKKIDAVCELIDTFDVNRGNRIEFSFNDEMVNPTKLEEDNYSITIRDEKDFESFKSSFRNTLNGFIQDEHKSKFWCNDYITMLAFLKKLRIEYPQIPMFKRGQKPKCIVDESRIDKFMSSYSEKSEQARLMLESEQNGLFETQYLSPDDLLSFFQGGDIGDDAR